MYRHLSPRNNLVEMSQELRDRYAHLNGLRLDVMAG